jgi:hypothetical protein
MKIKVLYSITALLILTLSFVVYASLNTTSAKTDSCCAMADCCKDGKCKMNHECCKGKDSCPMKSNSNTSSDEMKNCPMHKDMSAMQNQDGKSCDMPDCCKDGKCSMSADGKCNCKANAEHKCTEDCCKDGKCKMSADGKCNCNGESCQMMKKDSKEKSSMNHESCCKDGKCQMDCCKDGKCNMQAHKKDSEMKDCPMMKKDGENKDKTKDN